MLRRVTYIGTGVEQVAAVNAKRTSWITAGRYREWPPCIDMDKHGQPDAFRFRRTDYGNEQALTFGKRLGRVEASDMIP